MLRRLLQPGDGDHVPCNRDLARNLSFVLHERSDSKAVVSAVRAARRHERVQRRLSPDLSSPTTTSGHDAAGVSLWLTVTLGLPHVLADALATSPDRILAVDAETPKPQSVQFFRAPAMLSLPDDDQRWVGVAALILRPGRRTSHLATSGVHDWPSDRDAVLRALERLIHAHAGQWLPSRPLWGGPAELLLAAEIH